MKVLQSVVALVLFILIVDQLTSASDRGERRQRRDDRRRRKDERRSQRRETKKLRHNPIQPDVQVYPVPGEAYPVQAQSQQGYPEASPRPGGIITGIASVIKKKIRRIVPTYEASSVVSVPSYYYYYSSSTSSPFPAPPIEAKPNRPTYVSPEVLRPRPDTVPSFTDYYPKICGISTQTRIVGGAATDTKKWQWMAALVRKSGDHYCGGVLITDRHVLTAAHCMRGLTPSDMFVRLGDYEFNSNANPSSEVYGVKEIRVHPQYERVSHRNDIAILALERSSPLTGSVRPVCLPQKSRNYFGAIATVVGWGSTSYGGPAAKTLRQVSVPIWNATDCSEAYKDRVTDTCLCAGYEEGGKDACQGDSGGPLMLEGPNRRWMVVGIVSWGRRCGEPGNPGVYTRVNDYLTWISQKIY